VSTLLLDNALKPATPLTNGTINETLQHTLDISQGSVATHFRCGGIYSDSIITNFLLTVTVKYFENRIFGIVKAYKNGANFLVHPVYLCQVSLKCHRQVLRYRVTQNNRRTPDGPGHIMPLVAYWWRWMHKKKVSNHKTSKKTMKEFLKAVRHRCSVPSYTL